MKLRESNFEKLDSRVFDVLIVGGGINGAVSAAALATQGASVALIDMGDFASATSQQSSNLVWGGFKYLEGGELGLVRKLCLSRNRLIRAYPSSVREIRFFVTFAGLASLSTARLSCIGRSGIFLHVFRVCSVAGT
jgi:glycerol-3-phosphate dehydrogenase